MPEKLPSAAGTGTSATVAGRLAQNALLRDIATTRIICGSRILFSKVDATVKRAATLLGCGHTTANHVQHAFTRLIYCRDLWFIDTNMRCWMRLRRPDFSAAYRRGSGPPNHHSTNLVD